MVTSKGDKVLICLEYLGVRNYLFCSYKNFIMLNIGFISLETQKSQIRRSYLTKNFINKRNYLCPDSIFVYAKA